jgi:hypothetical protein
MACSNDRRASRLWPLMQRAAVSVVVLMQACTAIHIEPVDPSSRVTHVCIENNPKVVVPDFLDVIRDGFDRHGISTEVYSGAAPDSCEFTLTYTARQSWDFTSYLSQAELRMWKGGRRVAYAEYHLRGKGGYSMKKWQSTAAKMEPVLDRLLAAYR